MTISAPALAPEPTGGTFVRGGPFGAWRALSALPAMVGSLLLLLVLFDWMGRGKGWYCWPGWGPGRRCSHESENESRSHLGTDSADPARMRRPRWIRSGNRRWPSRASPVVRLICTCSTRPNHLVLRDHPAIDRRLRRLAVASSANQSRRGIPRRLKILGSRRLRTRPGAA